MRPLRFDWPEARHHVFNRTRRCEPIFEEDDACELFVQLLSLLPAKFGVRVHGYVLMPDHYHIMLESDGNLSVVMQWFMSMFVRKLNAMRPGWDGPLFRGRFGSKLVLRDEYWRLLLAYVHLNPVASGDAATPEEARWSSYTAYVGEPGSDVHPESPDWLTTEELSRLCGGPDGVRRYIEDVQMGRRANRDDPFARRRRRLRPRDVERWKRLRARGHSYRSIARRTGWSTSSVHRVLSEISTAAPRSTAPGPATSPTAHSP